MHLEFRFGRPHARVCSDAGQVWVELPHQVLAGDPVERWNVPGGFDESWRHGPVQLWGGSAGLLGATVVPLTGSMDAVAEALYRQVLDLSPALTLHRIWNFIPDINGARGELDAYKLFCMGRARAFEVAWGSHSELRMPPASAVGISGEALVVVFVAGPEPVRPVENPHQVPAYRYPSQYGPRAPSFARAGVVQDMAGGRAEHEWRLYISGTASIRASESLHAGDPRAQLQLALHNLSAVAEAAGQAQRWQTGPRRFRVYVRHAAHAATVVEALRGYIRSDDALTVVQAQICRPELLVEIEACLPEPDRSTAGVLADRVSAKSPPADQVPSN